MSQRAQRAMSSQTDAISLIWEWGAPRSRLSAAVDAYPASRTRSAGSSDAVAWWGLLGVGIARLTAHLVSSANGVSISRCRFRCPGGVPAASLG